MTSQDIIQHHITSHEMKSKNITWCAFVFIHISVYMRLLKLNLFSFNNLYDGSGNTRCTCFHLQLCMIGGRTHSLIVFVYFMHDRIGNTECTYFHPLICITAVGTQSVIDLFTILFDGSQVTECTCFSSYQVFSSKYLLLDYINFKNEKKFGQVSLRYQSHEHLWTNSRRVNSRYFLHLQNI